jgi:hypothetical protein
MNRVRFIRWIGSVGVLSGLALSACGGESTEKFDDGSSGRGGTGGTGGIDGVCEDITPCGGDPEGSWNVRENCAEVLLDGIVDQPGCEDAVGRGSAAMEGTFTFSNGVATQDTVVTAYVSVVIDDTCAQALVGSDMITAADLCPLLDAQLMANPDTPLRCMPSSAGCECEGEQPPMANTGTDTYEIVGSQLLLGSGDIFDFCQDGDELHLHGTTIDASTGADVGLTLLLDRL